MKTKILFLVLFFACAELANAQLTVDHVYTTDPPRKAFKIGDSGLKYFAEHLDLTIGSSTYFSVTYFILYNPDHSIYKTINVPQVTGKRARFISYVTETLFDTDSLIEYMLYYELPVAGPTEVKVINENGTILLDVDSANFTGSSSNDPYQGFVNQPIFPNGNQTKLYLYTNNYSETTVYNLPGQLPCVECSNGVISGLTQQPSSSQSNKSIAYPNPFTDGVKIKYILPENCKHAFINIYDFTGKMIKKKEIDNSFNEVYISNDEINQGAYFYQVVADDKVISGNKMIKI